jgi:hypothetical protein
MKPIPEYITCATGEATLAIAQYLETVYGLKRDPNLQRDADPLKDYFFKEGTENTILVQNGKMSWQDQHASTGTGFSTLRQFVASITPEQKKIKLNDSYTAIVSKEGTTVGCQTFDNAKILEVAEAIKNLG